MLHRPESPFAVPVPLAEQDWRDVVPVSEADLAAVETSVRADLLAVWVRHGGVFHPMVLTGWGQVRPGYWAARLQASPNDPPVWVHHKGASLLPIQPQVNTPPSAPPKGLP